MSAKSKQSLSLIFLLVLQSLFASIPSANWQGTGNMSSSNLTAIWDFIEGDQRLAKNTIQSDKGNFCVDFSNYLNGLWDPAWNVVVGVDNNPFNMVLYGYAFRDHWMWFSGYQVNSYIYTFVIWKDYNCQTWKYTNYDMGFNAQQEAQIISVKSQFKREDLNDIWATGKKFIDDLSTTQSLFVDPGLSIVISQSGEVTLHASFCSVEGKYLVRPFLNENSYPWYGYYFLFRTR